MSIFGASVSGMNSMSNWLSSIAQNVSNANTNGYKTSDTHFASLVGQAAAGSYAAGNGVTTSLRSLAGLQGTITGSSSATDLAVAGSGFFVVSDAGGALYLTRSGSFVPDASGNLVNSSGYHLMGYNTQNGDPGVAANSLSGMERVNIHRSNLQAVPTSNGIFTANLPSKEAIVPAAKLPSLNTAGAVYSQKTSIVAYDNLGGARTLDVYFTKTGNNLWEAAVFDQASAPTGGGFPYSAGPVTTQQISFDPLTGRLASGSPVSIAVPGGQTLTLDLKGTTQLSADYSVAAASVNGSAPGSLIGTSIDGGGILSFEFNNGSAQPGYRVPLANVPSPTNLKLIDGTAFQVTNESGPVLVGAGGAGGFGAIKSGSLEGSTVNLEQELTEMIEAQSSYQANSKVFQTGATLLDILNGLKT